MELDIIGKFGLAPEVKFRSDIPNEHWLASKRRYADESGKTEFGVPKSFGPVTGSFSRVLVLPVELLMKVKGERGEQSAVRKNSLDYIRDYIETNEDLPHGPPFMVVDYEGRAWMNEGNHRVMVSSSLGIAHLPVEVRYFSGGELVSQKGFSPEELMSIDQAFFLEKSLLVSTVQKDVRP